MRYVRFKGTPSQYTVLHAWVRRHLGKPQECENCGTTEAKKFEWANISEQYHKDLSDWARLCTSCHNLIDNHNPIIGMKRDTWKAERCVKGHPMVISNLFLKKDKRYFVNLLECRLCKHKPVNGKRIIHGRRKEYHELR